MPGRPGEALSLEEQLECAKMLREEQFASRNRSRGTGARGNRGVPRATASGAGLSSTRSARRDPNTVTSFPKISPSQSISRQGAKKPFLGNGGLLPGVGTAASSASKTPTKLAASVGDFESPKVTTDNNILPHMRHALQINDTTSSAASHQPIPVGVLQNNTNKPKQFTSSSRDSKEPIKLIQCAHSTSCVKKDPLLKFRVQISSSQSQSDLSTSRHEEQSSLGFATNDPPHYRNELARDVTNQVTDVDRNMPYVSASIPFTTLQSAPRMAGIEQTSQPRHHARNLSNTSDVDMTGIDTRADEQPRFTSRKHGGIAESSWAQTSSQALVVPQHVTSDPLDKRWIPTRVSDPTLTPPHLLPQLPSKATETTAVSAQVSAFVPRTSQTAQPLNSSRSNGSRRGGKNGGLASSQWAN